MEFRLGDTQNMAEHLFSLSRLMSRRGIGSANERRVGGEGRQRLLSLRGRRNPLKRLKTTKEKKGNPRERNGNPRKFQGETKEFQGNANLWRCAPPQRRSAGNGAPGQRPSKRLGDFHEMRRLVGIAAAPARGRFGDLVEGVQSDDRREHGMPAVGGDYGLPARVRLAIDEERRRAERGETVDGLEEPLTGGVRGREGENRKSRPDDPRRPVQHLGGR